MKMKSLETSICWFASILVMAGSFAAPLSAAPDSELKDDTGKVIVRYVAEAPAGLAPAGTSDPARQVGLFLCMPEHDRPTGDELMPVRQSLRRLGLSDSYVLIAASPQARKFGPADHEPLTKLIVWAKKTYPINPRRIYMYGKGEGGKISGEFVGMHPDLVAAAITYSWGFWVMPSELKEPLKHPPEIYMVLGLHDLPHHLTTVRDAYTRVKAKGYHVIYREFEGLAARTYHPPSNDDAILWATRQRNRNVPPSAEEVKLLRPFANGATPGADPGGYFPALALVGGAPAGAVIQKLLEAKDPGVRAAAAETIRRGGSDETTMAALAGRLSDPSAKVRKTAIRALEVHASWRSEAAQQGLISVATATEPGVDPEDRLSAVDALGHAVRYQITGVRQDPPMFRALVALLRDQNEEVRNMATAILLPVRDSAYKPEASNTDRNARAAAWLKWLVEIETKEAGYRKDYDVCGQGALAEPVALFCKGQPFGRDLASAFQNTMRAAELGYVPAQAAVGMMYANGKGVEQNYAEAGRWWVKAAEGGHLLAAGNAALLYRNGEGVPRDRAISDKWSKYVDGRDGNGGR